MSLHLRGIMTMAEPTEMKRTDLISAKRFLFI
jgi:hypothetical protein